MADPGPVIFIHRGDFSICENGGGGSSGNYSVEYDYEPATGTDGGSEEPGGGSNPRYPTPDPCQLGYVVDENGECVKKPCSGDPVKDPEIAPQLGPSGNMGGLEGCTRFGKGCSENGRTKPHDGIDIKNAYGEPVHAMHDGFVYNALYSDELGYLVQIQSNVDGRVIISLYAHMQNAGRVKTGNVKAGDIIGYQGDSGNLKGAIADGSTVSHAHIEVREHDGSNGWNYHANFSVVDPRPYLSTQIDDTGASSDSDCN